MYEVFNCGLFFVVGRGRGDSFNFHFLKANRLGFCLCVCIFYSALSYESHVPHCIPLYLQDIARERVCFLCACPYLSVLTVSSPPKFAFS